MFALRPIHTDQSLKEQKDFYVCDIEAYKWIKFRILGVYGPNDFYQEFRCLRQFFNFLVEDGQDKQIFAHFGGIYDFMFLMKQVVFDHDDSFEVTTIIPRGSGVLSFDVIYRDTYTNEDGKELTTIVKLRFNDSSALLPFGLENLTKSFDVKHKKGKFDFEKWDGKVTQELRDYLKDDCRGLYEVLTRFYNWPLIARSGRASTIASQAMRVFRTLMSEEIPPITGAVDDFVRKAYFGGRTEIFKPYYDDQKTTLKTYDVNSLYPFAMLAHEYPTQRDDREFYYNPKKMGFWHVDVEVPDMYVPPLGTVVKVPSEYEYYLKAGMKRTKKYESEKFVFPTGNFTGYWTTAELEYARSLGVKIKKVHRGITFKSGGKIFERYIETLYEMRLQAKKKGDGVTDIICKLLMNSLYGRFGMNLERENLSLSDEVSDQIHMMLEDEGRAIPIYTVPTVVNTFVNAAIPCYVTSYSRIIMHKHLAKCGEKIWYTDTDSLFTPKTFKDSGELGGLKLEYESKRACFLLPKTYVADGVTGLKDKDGNAIIKKLAMKGFDNKLAQNFTLDDFKHALEGDVGVLKLTNPSKMARFKTALRKKDFLVMMDKQERQVKSSYDKRRVYKTRSGGYDTEPLHIKDGEVINALGK